MTQESFESRFPVPDEIKGLDPALRVVPMPSDTNYFGDVFGGWMLSQMDIASAATAYKYLGQRLVTVGVDAMNFHKPVHVGDEVSLYCDIVRIGNTSITIHVDCWVFRREGGGYERVTEGKFTFVQIDEDGKPKKIDI